MTDLSHADIDNIFSTLAQSHRQRVMHPSSARKRQLRQLLKAILENEPRIIRALKCDLGRPAFETYVLEIATIKSEIKLALGSLRQWCERIPVSTPMLFQPGTSYIEPTPKGVVLIILPKRT